MKYQASAWMEAGNLYVPFYRQAHIRVFNEKFKEDGKKALDLAYSDIRDAFKYFLTNFNNGKPFIIASHSQGTVHAKRLISEFIDGKELQDKLIAAYLVGIKVYENDLVGKAQFIFFSSDKKIGSMFAFWKWHKSIRFNRTL